MDGAKEDLVDMFIVHTPEEIQVPVHFYIKNITDLFIINTYQSHLKDELNTELLQSNKVIENNCF